MIAGAGRSPSPAALRRTRVGVVASRRFFVVSPEVTAEMAMPRCASLLPAWDQMLGLRVCGRR
jgi:hypothetical protein